MARTILTAARRARLEKLAAYLEQLPRNYRHFDMWYYFAGDGATEEKYALHNGGVASCGTVACAVGHGPAAGVLVPRRFVAKGSYAPVDWNEYAGLFVGSWENILYTWLFAGQWKECDNHHYGAAARIRYLLANGAPPSRFEHPEKKWRRHYSPYRADRLEKALAEQVTV